MSVWNFVVSLVFFVLYWFDVALYNNKEEGNWAFCARHNGSSIQPAKLVFVVIISMAQFWTLVVQGDNIDGYWIAAGIIWLVYFFLFLFDYFGWASFRKYTCCKSQ